MKKVLTLFLVIFTVSWVMAQEHGNRKDSGASIANRLNLVEKKSDKLNIYLNFQGSFDMQDEGTEDWGGNFRVSNLRLEIQGNLTDKLFYRLRHRLNKSNRANSLDNLSSATDIMYAGYHFSDKFTFIFGRQFQAWGGFEYDLNPIFVYQFSDYGDYVDCFMTGATFSYTPNKNHEIAFQITDSRSSRFEDLYGDLSSQNIEKSKMPLTYILNWNGNLFEDKIKTRWAIAAQTEAKDKYTYSVSLGTMLNLPKFQLAFDYMMDNSDLDRLGIATMDASPFLKTINNNPVKVLEDVNYNSFIAKAEYQPKKNWNLFLKGMYETANVKSFDTLNDFRTSYGYLAGIEYLPFEDQDMRVFLTYVGRKVEYDHNLFNDYDTNRVSLGIIYRIKAF